MTADILTTAGFPHGTPTGYRLGCRSSWCPADTSCRVVHRRYQGDFGFRRMFDAGESVARILELEAEAEARDRAASRARPTPVRKSRKGNGRPGIKGRIPQDYPHGTYQRARQGCTDCPNPAGEQCIDAQRAYKRERWAEQQRASRARKKAAGEAVT